MAIAVKECEGLKPYEQIRQEWPQHVRQRRRRPPISPPEPVRVAQIRPVHELLEPQSRRPARVLIWRWHECSRQPVESLLRLNRPKINKERNDSLPQPHTRPKQAAVRLQHAPRQQRQRRRPRHAQLQHDNSHTRE